MFFHDDFECPICGGWAQMKDGRVDERTCDDDCELPDESLERIYAAEQDARAEAAFERGLSGDHGPLPLQEQLGQARRLK